MIAAYSTKINGVWYKAGEELPEAPGVGEVEAISASPDIPGESAAELYDDAPKPKSIELVKKEYALKSKSIVYKLHRLDIDHIVRDMNLGDPNDKKVIEWKAEICRMLGY